MEDWLNQFIEKVHMLGGLGGDTERVTRAGSSMSPVRVGSGWGGAQHSMKNLPMIHLPCSLRFLRWTYLEFYSRYGILMTQQELSLSDKKEVCKVVLHRLIQVGLACWALSSSMPLKRVPSCASKIAAVMSPVARSLNSRHLLWRYKPWIPQPSSHDPIPSSRSPGHRTQSDEALTQQKWSCCSA